MNKGNNTDKIFVFLFSSIALNVLSLSVSVIMVNAQAYSSDSTPSSSISSGTNDETHVTQMGICVVGAGGPCNGNSNSAK